MLADSYPFPMDKLAAANLGDLNNENEYKSTLEQQYNLITAEVSWGAIIEPHYTLIPETNLYSYRTSTADPTSQHPE